MYTAVTQKDMTIVKYLTAQCITSSIFEMIVNTVVHYTGRSECRASGAIINLVSNHGTRLVCYSSPCGNQSRYVNSFLR